jgi:hypothetical protein
MGDYKILPERDHVIVVNANNDFILSADTHQEAIAEITILLSEQ